MLLQMIRFRAAWLPLAASALLIFPAQATDSAASTANALAQASPLSVGEYRRLLRDYQEARGAFEEQAGAYWNAVTEKRRGRNAKRRDHQPITLDDYVLQQPPIYTGPKRPVNPEPEPEQHQTPDRPHNVPPDHRQQRDRDPLHEQDRRRDRRHRQPPR